jgi:DNA-binding winged helix-turn-helix (wHTH) protein/Tol biopolymer transport system component
VLETDAKQVIRFGTFEVDPHTGELRKNGLQVKLQDQPFQVLLALLEKPGGVVTREELRAKLWPADTFVDFNHGLNAAVKRLRDALGDSAENPRFIETLAKRGYRFLVPLQGQAHTPSPAVPTPASPAPTAIPLAKRQGLLIGASVSLLLAGAVMGWYLAHRVSPKPQPTEQRLTANSPDIPVRWAGLSPDGKYLGYWDRTGLFVKMIATGETHALNLPSDFTVRPGSWFVDSRYQQVTYAGWFPDSSDLLITYHASAGRQESIWIVSVLGGNPKKLIEDGEARAVSPDGSQIAFVRGAELPQALWVMHVDGSQTRKLVGQSGDIIAQVAWSPDNQKLAFVRYMFQPGSGYAQGKGALGIYNFDNGATNYILYDPWLERALAWTRDNRLIYSLREPSPNSDNSNLWAVPVDPRTGAVRGPANRLTDSPDRKALVSVSDSGKALTYLRMRVQAHIYVAKVERNGETNAAPIRMKLDEGNNQSYAWTPDGESVLFASDRDGVRHLYKQGVGQLAPDLLVGGDAAVGIVRMSPDRSEILYSVGPVNRKVGGVTRILAIPVSGGGPREVLRADGIDDFQCARAPADNCIMEQPNGETAQFSTFDPKTGTLKLALTIQGGDFPDGFSPDGTTIAVAPDRSGRIPGVIQLYSLRDSSRSTLEVKGWGGIYSIDWNPDGKSLWIGARTLKDVAGLVNVDLRGNVTPLVEDAENNIGFGVPSPDGSRVAYWRWDASSSVWLLHDF